MAAGVIGKVAAGGGTHSITATFYGTCATAAATAAKEVIINDTNVTEASFINGMTLAVKFTYANGVASPTLTCYNNSGTAASPTKGSTTLLASKSIIRYGTTAPSTSAASSWNAGSVVIFVYDGTYWQIVNWLNNNDNTVPSVYCSTGAATAAKVGTLSTASWSGLTGNRYLVVDIYYDNTAAAALTFNVASQGAKSIYINGTASSASNHTLPRGTYIVFYDGTNFYFRTDGKIPKLKTSGSIGVSTTNIGSASAGTAIPADDITDWSAGTLPTLGTAIPADDITAWTTNTPTAVTKKTVVTDATFNTVVTSVTPATVVTSVTKKTVVTGTSVTNEVLSFTTGDSVSSTTGASATVGTGVSGTKTTGDSVTVTAGTAASLSYTAKSIPNVTAVGTLPSLSYTAKSIPNISVTSTSVATGLTEA